MKKKMIVAALASVMSLPFAASSFAQNDDTSGASANSSRSVQAQTRNEMRASELLGKEVRNQQGQELGEIEDVLVDVSTGRVQYAVLSFGGFMDMGDELFTFPLSAFDRSQRGEQLVLNVSSEQLQKAEGFDEENWPVYGRDKDFFDRVQNLFGGQPAPDVTSQARLNSMRLSNMMGQDVSDRSGEYVGEIENVVVDMGRGRISYVLMEFDRDGTPNDKLIPLPMSALAAPTREGQDVILKVAREHLDRRMDVDRNNWPNLNDQAYQRNMDRYITSMERNMQGERETAQQRRQQTSGGLEGAQEEGAFELDGPTQPMPAEADDNVLHPN
jgi:sporulation protein YlmC with PRC-barrel domain